MHSDIRNPLSAYKSARDKNTAYNIDCGAGAMAYKSNDTKIPLQSVSCDDVEFVGGLWRVQDKNNYDIRTVRDRRLIMGARLPYNERTFFEYYSAALLTYNCYGVLPPVFDVVVAKYTTDHGTYWSYGKTIADARAYLGIRLYDEYMDLIHSVACKNMAQVHGK